MEENHMTYTQEKASPSEWQEMFQELDVLGPQRWLSHRPICRFLMDLWWPLRYEAQTGLVYLPFAILYDMSQDIGRPGRNRPTQQIDFAEGPFFRQYSSVQPSLTCRRVGFILIRNLHIIPG